MAKIEKLIAEYELASDRMTDLINHRNTPQCKIQSADKNLDRTFDAMLNANADCEESLINHIEYLLKEIKSLYPDDNILVRLADGIHRDIAHLQLNRGPL